MGMLIDGVWHDVWYDTASTGGRFVRSAPHFRDQVGPGALPAEPGRYHLYVSHACPWAHRTLIVRALKRLETVIGVSVVQPLMLERGWVFDADHPDHVAGAATLAERYVTARADYTGRVTVPVLWDTQRDTIVNNESQDIVRILTQAFDAHTDVTLDLYPKALRAEIDAVNEDVYAHVNNGVYRAGFATTQEAYEEAYDALFAALDRLERRLEGARWLVNDQLTEADIRLFTTLVRFDAVYHGHFKCNRQRLVELPNLWALTRRVYQLPGVAATVHMDAIKRHYYGSHRGINPTGIVPRGPVLALDDPA